MSLAIPRQEQRGDCAQGERRSGLYRLVLPLLLAGLLVSGGLFLLDDTFLPYANQRQDALRNEIKGRPAQTYFEPARQWIFGENSKIYNYELFDSDRQLFGGLNVFELDPATRFKSIAGLAIRN